jgi:O-antigen/teichoic acid export membrane protein
MMAADLLDRVGCAWVKGSVDVLGPSASLVGTTVVTSVLGFAYWWAAARMAPIHQVGAATAVISAVTLLGTIGMFGFGTMLIAEAGRCRDVIGPVIATSLLAVTVLATVLAAACWAALQFSGGAVGVAMAPPWVAAGFITGVGLTAAGMVLDQALVGIRASSVQLYRNSYFSVVKLALFVMVAVTIGSRSQVTMVWAWVAGIAISMVPAAWHLAARGCRLGQPVRLSALRGRGGMTFHHNTLNLSLTLPRLGLPLLVASLLGAHATAAFYAAWMICSFLYILPTHLSTALFAVAVGDIGALTPRLRAAMRVSLLLGGSVAVAIAALAGLAMGSFGPGYEIARTALVVMAIAYFPNVFKQCYVAVARVNNRLRKAGAVCGTGAVLELCLTGVAGRLDGLTGIALGFLAAVTLEAVYYVPAVLRALRPGGMATPAGPVTPGTLRRREKGA